MKMTATDRLITTLNCTLQAGGTSVHFYTGRYTGVGTSVVNALRSRGYTVTRKIEGYELRVKETVPSSANPVV